MYPIIEYHTRKEIIVDEITLVLAMRTNASMENQERYARTYAQVLYPLLENLKFLMQKANILNWNEEWRIAKFPNYGSTEERTEHVTSAIWDALRVQFGLRVRSTCYRPVKF